MKFTLSWLKKYLDTDADLKTVTDKLTAIGLEVEDVIDRGAALAPFIIAEVQAAEQHPNADRLKVCRVSDGKNIYQIVCGAPNARAGMRAVLSLPGMVIPSTGEALKKGAIRGVESQGMLCSSAELGLGEDAGGIIELPADAPIGAPYAKTYGLDDALIEINLTPNRADCAGIYGVARDLAAAGIGALRPVTAKPVAGKFPSPVTAKIETPDCPQFALRYIKGVKNGPSPEWLQRQLRAVGLRPISALVDITNYFTLAAARPMHVFDAAKVKGNLRIAPAKGGEKLAALNDKEYTLPAGLVVIEDNSGPISLAGVVGGASTGVDEHTKDVLLEVALWNPAKIAEAGRKLEVITDARYRFERGVDPSGVLPAVEMATQMILEFCGGEASEIAVAGREPDWKRSVDFRPARLKTLGGVDMDEARMKDILGKLGFGVTPSGNSWKISIPSWRQDVEGEADIVEELLRLSGLDSVPAQSLPPVAIALGQAFSAPQKRVLSARRFLAGRGLLESVSFAFTSREKAELFGGGAVELRLQNPISADLDQMRPSILPNLLQAVKFNADRSSPDLALFEIGAQYEGVRENQQHSVAAIVRSGATPRHFRDKSRAVDVFDIKGDVLALLSELGVDGAKAQISTDAPSWYHPGQSGVLKFGPNKLAQFGAVHPKILAFYDIKAPVVAAEIFLGNIPLPKSKGGKARPLLKLPPFQAVGRDFAFVVDESVAAETLVKAAREADKNLIVGVAVFDQFVGKSLGEGKKSLAIEVTIQPTEKTLTDAEIEAVSKKIVDGVVAATGGTLRQ